MSASFTLLPINNYSLWLRQEPIDGWRSTFQSITMEVKLLTKIKLKNYDDLSNITATLIIMKDNQAALTNSDDKINYMTCSCYSDGSQNRWNIRFSLHELEFDKVVEFMGDGNLPKTISISGDNLEFDDGDCSILEWDNIQYPKIKLQNIELIFNLNPPVVNSQNVELMITIKSIQKYLLRLIWIIIILGIFFIIK